MRVLLYNTTSDNRVLSKSITLIKEIDAEIIATEGNKIVVRVFNGNDKEIKLNNNEKVCKIDNDCATLSLK